MRKAYRLVPNYVPGRPAVKGPLALPAGSSLSNSGDFLLAKDASGNFFAGAIDFLRICRSDLADSSTTIEELYDWEFAGPFLMQERAGEGPLGRALPQHGILIGLQELVPLSVSVRDIECLLRRNRNRNRA